MRTSALVSAAFAGCALGSPLVRRAPVLEIDTVYDVVYTTAYVTEIAGATPVAEATSSSTSAPAVSASFKKAHKDWFSFHWGTTVVASASAEVTTSAEATSTAVATSAAVTTAAPVTTSTVAPVISSTSSVYVAPSSSSVTSASAASTSSAAETSTTSAASSKATTYQQKVLVHHNVHRANHSASDLTWSADLASTAQTIAESCTYAHNVNTNGGGYGQNIAAGVTSDDISTVITDLFYNGEVNYFNGLYGQANPSMSNFESWGHFSQIVWKGTTQVGCATVDCSSKGLANVGSNVPPYFTVCNYKSPGNYAGEYGTNIGASLGRASVSASYGL